MTVYIMTVLNKDNEEVYLGARATEEEAKRFITHKYPAAMCMGNGLYEVRSVGCESAIRAYIHTVNL